MIQVGIVSPSPLLAGGVHAALSAVAEWQVSVHHGAVGDAGAGVQVLVVHARDAAESLALHAALPAQTAAVLLGDELRELSVRSAAEPRPLALLPPTAQPGQLRAAVAAVLQGLSVREAAVPWPQATPRATAGMAFDHEPLTPRELEVYEWLGKGLSNRDIGGVLGISAHTAKYHVGQILAKVGAATRAEAVSCGLKLGLIGL